MCEVEEEDLERVSVVEAPIIAPEKKLLCVKCGEEAVIHLRDEDAKCAKCFTSSVVQKFRTVLSKHHISKCREKILVAITGGNASSALLQLIREATGASHHSRLYFVLVVIHIDDSLNFAVENNNSRFQRIQNILDVAQKVDPDWTRLYSSLEMIFANEAEDRVFTLDGNMHKLEKYYACRSRLRLLFDSVRSGTAKEELVKLLRAKLLTSIGKQLGITKMFVGDCVDRLAVQLITNTSLGKGKHLPIDLAYLDARDPSFTIIRPLKEVTVKEILMFNKLNGVPTVMVESKDAAQSERSTVFQMTKTFIDDLQKEFPQTVTTLCKTADKLAVTGVSDNSGAMCDICSGAVDSGISASACTAEASIALSLKLSSSADVEDVVEQIGGCDRKNGSCQADSNGDSRDDEQGSCCRTSRKQHTNLCYFCRWMLSEMKDPELLPEAFTGWTTQEARRQQMRESIQEFLLDDAEG